MTLILKLDLDMVKIYLHTKNEVPMWSSSKVIAWQTDRHNRKQYLHAFAGDNNNKQLEWSERILREIYIQIIPPILATEPNNGTVTQQQCFVETTGTIYSPLPLPPYPFFLPSLFSRQLITAWRPTALPPHCGRGDSIRHQDEAVCSFNTALH